MLSMESTRKSAAKKTTVIGKPKDDAVQDPGLSNNNEQAEKVDRPSDPDQAHSRLGPSSSERWLNCLGSVLYTKDMPDVASEYAAEGTAAHELSEWVRESGKPAKKFIGKEIAVEKWVFTVDVEMASAVQRFCDFCEDFEGAPLYEERVHYTTWVPDGWGTADDIRIEDGGTCHVTDLKYGKGVQVWAKDNPQLRLYALGVFQDFQHLYDIKDFHLTIHQPRLGHVDEVWISVKELLLWARDVVAVAAQRALEPNAPFVAGDWCRFCPGKLDCEARAQQMMEVHLADFEDLDDVEEIPGFKLGEIMDKMSMIRSWLTDIEAKVMREVQQGSPITGKAGEYKLVEGRSNRMWKDPAEAEAALRKVPKLKVADIFTRKLISAPQAEKLVGKNHPIMKELVEKPRGKPVLVPGSDPRPTLQVKAEDEFDDLENGDKV